MFCIDYLFSYSSRGRQIVFLISTEETVSETNRGQARRSDAWGQGGIAAAWAAESLLLLSALRNATGATRTHSMTNYMTEMLFHIAALCKKVRPNWKCVQSDKMDGSGSGDISSIAPRIKPGRKSISSGWLCSRAQPKQRSVYFECLSTSFIQAQIHFSRVVDTLRSKTRTR